MHGRGIRFLSDIDKLNSTPELRESLKDILDKNFNKRYPRCPPHLYYFFSTIFGALMLTISISLIKFVGNIGFALLPLGILGIISPLFFVCWSDSRNSNIFYNTIKKIDSETFGIHKMAGTFSVNKYVNQITLSTNADRLRRNNGVIISQKAKEKPQSPKKIDPPKNNTKSKHIIINEDIPLPTKVEPPKPGPTLPGYNQVQNPMMNPGQPNRFSQPGMNPMPFPMQGPQPTPMNYNPVFGPMNNPAFGPMNNPNKGQMQGPFMNPGPFNFPPPQNSPFGPSMNPNNDLMIHEVNIGDGGGNNQMKYGNDLYTVPSNVIDDHGNGKKQ